MVEKYPDGSTESYKSLSNIDSLPLIAGGISRYNAAARRLTEYYTGNKEVFLSAQEEYDLAEQMQVGKRASDTFAALPPGSDEESDEDLWYRAQLRHETAVGQTARTKLIETNLRLAAYFARASVGIVPKDRLDPVTGKPKKQIGTYGDITSLKSPYASLEDRMAIANMGLIDAVDHFTPKIGRDGKPISLSTYAPYRIHGHLLRYVATQEFPCFTFSAHIGDKLRKRLDPAEASPVEILEQQALRDLSNTVSLEHMASQIYAKEEDDEDESDAIELAYAEAMPDGMAGTLVDRAVFTLLQDQLQSVFLTLSEREAGVIKLRFGLVDGEPKTLDEIGMVYGVTRERVRQIESKAMTKLRHPSRSQVLREYLDMDFNEPTAENGLLGLHATPPLPELASFMLRPTSESSSFNGVLPAQSDNHGLRGDWRVEPGEDWDAPVRKTSEQMADEYEAAGRQFDRIMQFAETRHFETGAANAPDQVPFPAELIQDINDACGSLLRPEHIEAYWNNHIDTLIARLSSETTNLNVDRISKFFSRLLAERMADEDVVHLMIPESLHGKLHYFGSDLAHGTLHIYGDLGDHTAHAIQSLGQMIIHGSVGDYAAEAANGYAVLEVTGNAGKAFAYGASNGTLRVGKRIETLTLSPRFNGDVIAGSVGHIHTGAPLNHLTIG